MIIFQKKVVKFGKERLVIEIPKELRKKITAGDTVLVSKKEFPILRKDLNKLSKNLKGKHVELTYDQGIVTTEAYLLELKDNILILSDKKGEYREMHNLENSRIISLQPKIILKGHYVNGQKVTKDQYKKALSKREFGTAAIVYDDHI